MVVKGKEELSLLEIYRPVIGGVDKFMSTVKAVGNDIFGYAPGEVSETVGIGVGAAGVAEPEVRVESELEPRLHVYEHKKTSLRLPLVDLRALPVMRYGKEFRRAYARLENNPEESISVPLDLTPADLERLLSEDGQHTGLGSRLELIGLRYGIGDQHHIDIMCTGIDTPLDGPLSHLGDEVALVPDTTSKAGMMLVEQAQLCLRGISRKSKKATNPYTPSALRIPFARIPPDSTPSQKSEFYAALKEKLPQPIVLGGWVGNTPDPSWQPEHR